MPRTELRLIDTGAGGEANTAEDFDFDALPAAGDGVAATTVAGPGQGNFDRKARSDGCLAPRPLNTLKDLDPKVVQGQTYESKALLDVSMREIAELERKYLRAGKTGRDPKDGKPLRSDAVNIGFSCALGTNCTFCFKFRWSAKTGVWVCKRADEHTCPTLSDVEFEEQVALLGDNQRMTNYTRPMLSNLVVGVIRANLGAKSGGTVQKHRIADLPGYVVSQTIQPYLAIPPKMQFCHYLKKVTLENLMRPEEELAVRTSSAA